MEKVKSIEAARCNTSVGVKMHLLEVDGAYQLSVKCALNVKCESLPVAGTACELFLVRLDRDSRRKRLIPTWQEHKPRSAESIGLSVIAVGDCDVFESVEGDSGLYSVCNKTAP